jgi:hypothetical protein
VKFSIKAQFQDPSAPATAAGGRGAAGRGRP